jgi:predicted PurR-regulated permease PerM
MNQRFRKPFLVLMVVGITIAFVAMIQSFLMTILVATIFTGLTYPLFTWLVRIFRGRRTLASVVTLAVLLLAVFGPVLAILGIIVNQAVGVTTDVRPLVERLVNEPTYLDQVLRGLPGYSIVEPYKGEIVTRAGELVGAVGGFLVSSLSETTRGTAAFIFHFFLFLYTLFFLLIDGPGIRDAILARLPLSADEARQMKDRFMSITRATVKGTLVIGLVQGTMAGLAFWVAGIPQVLFWTAVMVVLSVLPVIGSALVWVPACIILIAMGQVWTGVLLALYCALIVGSVDNVLRPRLVGRDTQMHDLVILFSTLGGILAFGPVGFIIGPILAGLFQTSWDIFAMAYGDAGDGTAG